MPRRQPASSLRQGARPASGAARGLGVMPGKRISEPLTGSLVGLRILVNRQNDNLSAISTNDRAAATALAASGLFFQAMATVPERRLGALAGAISTGRPVAMRHASSTSMATGSPSRARPTTTRSAVRPCSASHVGSSPISTLHSAEGRSVERPLDIVSLSRSQRSWKACSAFFRLAAASCSSD